MNIISAEFIKGVVQGAEIKLDPSIPQIVLYGRSNAGKSSTVNTLTNRKALARTSNTPGLTKEINFFLINKQFYLVDVPGYGYAKVSKDSRVIIQDLITWFIKEVYTEHRKSVLIIDSKIGLMDSDREVLQQLTDRGESIVILLNKIDRLTQSELAKTERAVRDEVSKEVDIVSFSARTGKGMDKFWEIVIGKQVEAV